MQKQENDFIPYEAVKTVAKGKTLVFAPHPDDEVFGCGGAIIRHIQQGDTVKVVIITDGSYLVTGQHAIPEYKEIRKEESCKAAKVLAYGEPEFLDYPDRGLKFNEKLIMHLLEIIRQFQPQNIYLPGLSEIHPDHLVLSKAATEAVRRYEPDINLYYFEIGQMQSANILLDITGLQERLNSAMDCFPSQLEVLDYKYYINALHAYRTYTLGKEVKFAEAYHFINSKELKTGSDLWKRNTASLNLPDKIEPAGQEYPLISVIVRTMNRPELAEALESLSKQTYPNIEVIVVDALGTGELNLGDRCGNSPLRVVSENIKLPRAAAANVGLHAVKGDYFCFLDEDDLLFPDHLVKLFNVLKNSKSPSAYSNIKRVNSKNEILNVYNTDFNFHKLLWSNFIPLHALLFRTEPIKFNCLFDDKLEIYEDWDFLLQVGQLDDFAHLDEITGIYRDTSTSGAQDDEVKINKYRTLLLEKWKTKLTKEHYISFLYYLSTLNLQEKELYKTKYTEEQHKFEEAQGIIKAFQKEKQQILAEHKTLLDEREKETASREKEILKKDHELDSYKSEKTMLNKSLVEKDNVIDQKNIQLDDIKNDLFKFNKQLNKSDAVIVQLTRSLSWYFTKPLRLLNKKNLKSELLFIKNRRKIKQSGLFDEAFYLDNNPMVKQSGYNPLKHFILHGGFEGRNPGPAFDSAFYLDHYPDVAASGMNPLLHYVLHGIEEGRVIQSEKVTVKPISTKNKYY